MAGNNVNKVFQANAYIEGNNFLGLISEIDLPTLTATTQAHESLSGLGSFDLPTGFDALESRFKWVGQDQLIDKVANDFYTVRQIQVYSQIEKYSAGVGVVRDRVVYYLTGRFKSNDLGKFSAKNDVENEAMLSITAFKKEVNGVSVIEYDAVNTIYKVNGIDLLAETRANLGY